jgi:deoxyribose-phosphate aldolase
MNSVTAQSLAAMIDHTNLRPEATRDQIIQLSREAMQFGFAAVCVNPAYVPLAAEQLGDSAVKVATVVGFPLGATPTDVKVFEAAESIRRGAKEIDMVQNIGFLKSGDHAAVLSDIRRVAEATHTGGAILKVILETILLSDDDKRLACQLAVEAGADFVKTSTGFLGGGATVADIRLMRAAVGPNVGVKASGGVRTLADAMAMIEAGANRIGTSSGVAIVQGIGS